MNRLKNSPLGSWLPAFILLNTVIFAHAETTIYYPQPFTTTDRRQDFPLELLQLAFSKSKTSYRLMPSKAKMHQLRALSSMESNSGVDVVWTMTSIERENQFRPIRIPIHRGLAGWRIPLIKQTEVSAFKQLKTRRQVQGLTAGQGHDWPDTEILRHNKFNTVTGSSYEGLFSMLASGRIDYFPRSIAEIWLEALVQADKNLVVDQHVLIVYPAAMYFFVRNDASELALAIEQGLENAIASGEFEELFYRFHGSAIERSNLPERMVLKLENPLLPEITPLHRRELWFDLQRTYKQPKNDT